PFLSPPPEVLKDPFLLSVLQKYSDLFDIVTPINVDHLEFYISSHPNCNFVDSVCHGLREGFWPGHHLCWDESKSHPSQSPEEEAFLYNQHDKEVALQRFSPAFGPVLPQGMYSMSIHAVPKQSPHNFRMVTNHSAGKHALNLMIPQEAIEG
ncbi:hypothetical protein BDQ17DRAFT_1254061, partial [Cyathus striatus]